LRRDYEFNFQCFPGTRVPVIEKVLKADKDELRKAEREFTQRLKDDEADDNMTNSFNNDGEELDG
jgi:hypothetical protein